jgi:hypothetical protein
MQPHRLKSLLASVEVAVSNVQARLELSV